MQGLKSIGSLLAVDEAPQVVRPDGPGPSGPQTGSARNGLSNRNRCLLFTTGSAQISYSNS